MWKPSKINRPVRLPTDWKFIVLLMWAFGTLSCVRTETPREEYARTRLMMARDIHGIQLQWMSAANRRYALMFRDPDSGDPRWQVVPEYREIRGTGELITLRFTDPVARGKEYRLQTLVGVVPKN